MNYAFLQPLLGGILIGLASWLLLASLGRVAGISSITADLFARSEDNAGKPIGKPSSDASDSGWRMIFVVGLVFGGLIAAQFIEVNNSLANSLPASATRPWWLMIVAGLLVGVGTVVGSGCTSGHGVCGLGRRSVRSLVAVLTFMGVGMATVAIVYALTGRAIV